MSHEIYVEGARDQCGCLNRAAGNPLNEVIYLVLNTMRVHAGCSGDGSVLPITRQRLIDAKKRLAEEDFSYMTDVAAHPTHGIAKEAKFVDNCLSYMDEHQLDTVDIRFG